MPEPTPTRPKLLVVDDQAVNIQLLYKIFSADHEVFMATSGQQALQACAEKRPDLILLDVLMPGMDGHEVCRRLKADAGTRDIPVIFLTGQNNPDEEAAGLALGAVDFIHKPVNAAVVRARVRTHLLLGHALARLQDSEAQARAVIEASPIPYALNDAQQNITYINTAFTRTFGYTLEDIPNLQAWWPRAYPDPDYRETVARLWQEEVERSSQTQSPFTPLEISVHCKDGSTRAVLVSATAISGSFAQVHLVTLFDITEHKAANQALLSALHEKDALLKEVHHRVKNNLQVITSLLRLESGRSDAPAVKSALGDMQNRIRSMALLHEMLYRSGTLAQVELGAYFRQLVTQSFRALLPRGSQIQLELELASVQVGMDQAAPCGLLVSELLSNSLKHGFTDGRSGTVRVELQPAAHGLWRLCVSDTGVGLAPDFAERRKTSLGLQLVGDLALQLNGTLEISPERESGTSFAVTFAVVPPAALVISA